MVQCTTENVAADQAAPVPPALAQSSLSPRTRLLHRFLHHLVAMQLCN